MNILFYTPFNSRSRDTETLMLDFSKLHHKVFLLTQTSEGEIHQIVRQHNVLAYSADIKRGNTFFYFIRQLLVLLKFIKNNKIKVVYAHLEPTVFVTSIVRFLLPGVVFFACRHSVDEAKLSGNRNFIRLNKWSYKLAKYIIVVSERARQFMIDNEKIKASKIKVINLAYDYSLYPHISNSEITKIKKTYHTDLLLITACRLVASKRPEISIQVVENLVREKGIRNVKLLICGEGYMKNNLAELIKQKGLEEYIYLAGQVNNILNYLSASDILIHPSILDSSSVIIKEAGLCKKVVLACSDVGDVNDYLVHDDNALLTKRDNPVMEMTEQILRFLKSRENMALRIGNNLNRVVLKRFHISEISGIYQQMHKNIESGLPPF